MPRISTSGSLRFDANDQQQGHGTPHPDRVFLFALDILLKHDERGRKTFARHPEGDAVQAPIRFGFCGIPCESRFQPSQPGTWLRLRLGAKGAGRFVPVARDEALDEIAGRYKNLGGQ
jgi:hypothetical protein